MTAGSPRRRRPRAAHWLVLAAVIGLLAPAWAVSSANAAPTPAPANTSLGNIVPAPAVVTPNPAVDYQLNPATVVFTEFGSAQAQSVGDYLAGLLRPATGYPVPVVPAPPFVQPLPGISLLLTGADPSVGSEGYQLDVTAQSVVIRANTPAGLYYGVQSLRQVLPARLATQTRQAGPWTVPGGHVVDYPRYTYRGAMLDVARHFMSVADVEKYIDEISLYKLNYLHLHLTDDQGWRIAINGWPRLTSVGGSTGENGGPGGYYTQAQYQQIVAYAQAHYVTIVPEVDVPAHSGAALASYAQLNCNDVAPAVYTGGGSAPEGTLCVNKPATFQFLDDVIGQLVALTPGPYFDIGGDEASALTAAQYNTFVQQVAQIAAKDGKKMLGWNEALSATTPADSTGEFWFEDNVSQMISAAQNGAKLLMAPCIYTYLDQKYAPNEPADPLGLNWAGYIDTQTAYSWDPTILSGYGVPDSAILGVESPMFTDTVNTLAQAQEMAFPRLPAVAEIGWSPQSTHDWTSFSTRIAEQAPLWQAMGINYFRADPSITWPTGS